MADKLERVQAYVDQTTYKVLLKMSDKHLRGHGMSQISGRILEAWIWDNQKELKENGITLVDESTDKAD